ncbi:MAG: hypothetical protein IJ708_16725 [Clostridia bacterium]|jgi:hypothetical protein|nr:hypothetical protein [Clostridia bacterium]
MSCHDIGRGMNDVVRRTITLYDRNEIALEPAKKIIATCENAVNWCDGNSYEALDYIRRCRCGKCLKLVPKGEKLYSIYDLPYEYENKYPYMQEELELASDGLCEECFDRLMPAYCYGDWNIESMKKYIENDDSNSDGCLSEGQHREFNNKHLWREATYWYEL